MADMNINTIDSVIGDVDTEIVTSDMEAIKTVAKGTKRGAKGKVSVEMAVTKPVAKTAKLSPAVQRLRDATLRVGQTDEVKDAATISKLTAPLEIVDYMYPRLPGLPDQLEIGLNGEMFIIKAGAHVGIPKAVVDIANDSFDRTGKAFSDMEKLAQD